MKAAVADRGDATLTAIGAPSRPGILLDRDGTIIVDHGYVGSVDRVEFIAWGGRGDRHLQPGGHPGRGSD